MELTIDQALRQGVAAHREGKLQEAELLYRAILQEQPNHPDANHNLGALAVLLGRPLQALPFFTLALEANPHADQFWLSYIDALLKAEWHDEANQALADALTSGISPEKLGFFREKLAQASPQEGCEKARRGLTLSEKRKRLAEKKKSKKLKKGRGALLDEAPSQDQLNLLLSYYQAGRMADAEELAVALTEEFPSHPFAWKVMGVVLEQTGRVAESLLFLQRSVMLSPQDSEAHNNLGNVLDRLGRSEEAEASYKQAIKLKPDYAEARNNLGNALKALGRLDEAEASYKQTIALKPDYAEAHNNLGATLKELDRLSEAEESYRQAIELKPDYATAHSNLGVVLREVGSLNEAEAAYRQAIALRPDYPEALNNLANTLLEGGRLGDAEAIFRQAIVLKPEYAEAHSNLGNTLRELGRLDEAEASYRHAITLKADFAHALSNLGITLQELGRLDEAEASYRQAIAVKPSYAEAHSNLGITLQQLGRLDEAEASYKQAIALKPDYAEAHNNLGTTVQELGKFDEAEASFRRAIAIKPGYAEPRDNLLFAFNYDHRLTAADLYSEYIAYGEAVAKLTERSFAHDNRSSLSGRRIRVGYSSPDFRGHVCRFFMEPLFRHHDRDQFELFAYSNTSNPDEHTERMKGYFEHWVDVVRMTDEEMALRIYDDKIDILVDMAGHTKGNRLPVFAMRPAPIQASSSTGFGYTTGLSEIDYFICDENIVPFGSEHYFSEEPWRLPAPGYVYEPHADAAPDVSELPALHNGYVTFGSLARTVRINDPLLRVWGQILGCVSNSRLRLDQKPFAHAGMRELFWRRLEGLGIPRERVDLTYSTPHWNAYHDIDITLDCWPHNAGSTTLESLWMGVPVLSKMDRPSVGRSGAAALRPLGLDDWLVESEDSFIERAVAAASDLDSLSRMRSGLRQRLKQSPHLDAVVFAGHLENAYRAMINSLEGG